MVMDNSSLLMVIFMMDSIFKGSLMEMVSIFGLMETFTKEIFNKAHVLALEF